MRYGLEYTDDGVYVTPNAVETESYVSYVDSLPAVAPAEVSISLQACYAVPGTDLVYAATSSSGYHTLQTGNAWYVDYVPRRIFIAWLVLAATAPAPATSATAGPYYRP